MEPKVGTFLPGAQVSTKGLTILHIEDDETIRKTIERILHRMFPASNIIGAASGEDALQALQEDPNYDLVISDWDIDGYVNGGDVFAWVREHEPKLLKRYIFLSGNMDAKEMCSMADIPFIEKPARPFEIRHILHAVLEAA